MKGSLLKGADTVVVFIGILNVQICQNTICGIQSNNDCAFQFILCTYDGTLEQRVFKLPHYLINLQGLFRVPTINCQIT